MKKILFSLTFLAAITGGAFLPLHSAHALFSCDGDLIVGSGECPQPGVGVDPSVNITATPTTIDQGSTSRISWTSGNVTSCAVNQGIGAVTPNANGYRDVSPSSTTTYTITCQSTSSGPVSSSVTVTVTPPVPSLTVSCQVYPDAGDTSVTYLWAANASGGQASGSTSGTWVLTNGSGSWGSGDVSPGSTCTSNNPSVVEGGSCNPSTDNVALVNRYCYQRSPTCWVRERPDRPLVNTCSISLYVCMPNGGGGTTAYSYSWTGTDGLSGTGASVSKAYTTSGTKFGTVTVTSGTGTGSAMCSVPVSEPAQPDLTAGSVSPSSATVGSSVRYTATMTNISGTTSADFPAIFQIENVDVYSANSWLGGLAPGGSIPAYWDHTFSSAGTYRVRSCANYTTSWAAVVNESDYANNCGPWTAVTVASAQSPSLSCTPSASSVNVGDSVTYTVSASGGATGPYSWLDSDGWTGSGSSVSRSYSAGGTYSMSVTGANVGRTYCSPQVSVAANTCSGTPTVNITASPTRVRAGNTSMISWSATNIPGASPSCTVSGPGVSKTPGAGAPPSCSIPDGSANPVINTQSTYTITCAGVSKSVTVNVLPKIIEF